MNNTWVITGASRGFGLATAKRVIANGDRVAILARGDEVFELAKELGDKALGVKVDVTQQESIDKGIAAVVEKWGNIDFLVNNAGLHRGGLIGDLSLEAWESVLDANLSGPFRMIKSVVPHMSGGGSIVNIGAVVGGRGFAGDAAYGASKNGLKGLSRVLAVELAYKQIRVNLVVPGFVMTQMTSAIPENARRKINSKIPLKREGKEDEIAEVIEWVARSTYMTGAIVPVDGGLSCSL